MITRTHFILHSFCFLIRPTSLIIALLSFVLTLNGCEELEYIEPFRWPKVTKLYGLSGNVVFVSDSSYPVDYMVQTNTYLHKREELKKIFLVDVAENGYPSFIYTNLNSRVSVEYYLNAETQTFNKIEVWFDGTVYTGVATFPETNAYKIQSNSQINNLVDVVAVTFNDDYSIKSNSTWNFTSKIESRGIYTTLSSDGGTINKKLLVYIANILESESDVTFNSNGDIIQKYKRIVNTSLNTVTTYIYSDFDSFGNYRKKTIAVDGITTQVIERTILYR